MYCIINIYTMINTIPSKLYLDYDMAIYLYSKMGDASFVMFLENHYVISMDKDCYYFLLSVKNDYDGENIKNI